jgi:hypothetical protein
MKQPAHCKYRFPKAFIIAVRVSRGVFLVYLPRQKPLEILAVFPRGNREIMLNSDIPFKHFMQHITDYYIVHIHRIRQFVARNAFRDVVQTPPEFVAAIME